MTLDQNSMPVDVCLLGIPIPELRGEAWLEDRQISSPF